MRVLVCGSRDWTDGQVVETVLMGATVNLQTEHVIIEGGARGADSHAADFATRLKRHPKFGHPGAHEQYPADWKQHGKAAGAIRNQRMLDQGRPDVVFAFKDGYDPASGRGGTEDMVRRAKAYGIPCYIVSHA